MTRIAIWARVSTDEQDATQQLEPLRELAAQLGGPVVREYVENESGRRGRRERRAFDGMLEHAARREFDLLLFWSLDRFSREGIRKTINYLQRLEQLNVRFKSYTEPYLDTENELLRYVVVGMLSYLAELQAKKISDDTKRGLEAARRKGKRIGRPTKYLEVWKDLHEMDALGYSTSAIARGLGLSENTARLYRARLKAEMAGAATPRKLLERA